jgi:hypothetical protein
MPGSPQIKTYPVSYFPPCYFFNSAGIVAAASSASPKILKFLRLNLLLNLRHHPLLAVKGLVSSSVPAFFLNVFVQA